MGKRVVKKRVIKKVMASALMVLMHGYGTRVSAVPVVDEEVVDKILDENLPQEEKRRRREPIKSREEWEADIVGTKSVHDAYVSEDMLDELYKNYRRSMGA